MDLFQTKNLLEKKRADDGYASDDDFKVFAEREMKFNGGRFVGYSDSTILKILREEISIYKHSSPSKHGETEAKK